MAFAAIAATVLSTGLEIAGGLSEASYKAQVAKRNQKLSEFNSKLAFERGQYAAEKIGMEKSAFIGEQVVAQSASGFSLSDRTAVKMRQSAAIASAEDLKTAGDSANIEKYNSDNQAAMYGLEAKNAKATGIFNAIGAGLNLIGTLAQNRTVIGSAMSTAFARKYPTQPISQYNVPSYAIRPRYPTPHAARIGF